MSTLFGPIDYDEIKTVQFSFANEIPTGKTIASVTIAISVKEGADATPNARLFGAATVSGMLVLQRVQPNAPGITYHLRARAVDSDGNAHVVPGDLKVVSL